MVKNVYFFAQNSVFSSANCPNGKTQEKYALTQENYAKTQSFGHCSASKCQIYGFKKACCKCHIVRDKKQFIFLTPATENKCSLRHVRKWPNLTSVTGTVKKEEDFHPNRLAVKLAFATNLSPSWHLPSMLTSCIPVTTCPLSTWRQSSLPWSGMARPSQKRWWMAVILNALNVQTTHLIPHINA